MCLRTSKGKKVTYLLICFFALFMLFMLFVLLCFLCFCLVASLYFLCFLCFLSFLCFLCFCVFVLFVFFVTFFLLVCVWNLFLKKNKNFKTALITSFTLLLTLSYYKHEFFLITIFLNCHNIFQLSQSFSSQSFWISLQLETLSLWK